MNLSNKYNSDVVENLSVRYNYAALPTVQHLTLTLPVSSPIMIIGDIHGCYDELRELIEKCGFNDTGINRLGTIITVGDLVAKGPKSIEVLEYCMSRPVLAIRGNHEHCLLKIATTLHRESISDSMLQNLDKHEKLALSFTEAQLQWIQSLPISLYVSNHDLYVVHAGFKPNVPIETQSPEDCMHMRNVDDHGNAMEESHEGQPWINTWKQGSSTVVFGHDSVRGLQLRDDGMAYGLDSGCVYGEKLTALVIEPTYDNGSGTRLMGTQKRFVSVNAHRKYVSSKKYRRNGSSSDSTEQLALNLHSHDAF